jgi:hypothetical protein
MKSISKLTTAIAGAGTMWDENARLRMWRARLLTTRLRDLQNDGYRLDEEQFPSW